MSGWKRLGVVISVLWLIGSPFYYLVSEHKQIEREFETCTSISPAADPLARMLQLALCNTTKKKATTIPDLLKLITFQSIDPSMDPGTNRFLGVVVWIVWLGPVVLFWIVSGTVIGITRWVMRGF